MKRFKVIGGSQSWHCCFDFTVVDTSQPVIICGKQYENQFEAVCECFGEENAQLICDALNLKHELEQGVDYVAARSII